MSVDQKKINEILPHIIKLRRTIHQNPELNYQEFQTASLIAETLRAWGYEPIIGLAKTGLYAILDSGKPGKTVALRAEMDALPILEELNLDYSSQNVGVMHACGHDGHVATLLLAAYLLQDLKYSFVGKIKFIFQPAEEKGQGAEVLITEGILDNPPVDAIFGYHNIPTFAKNKIYVRTQCILAGCVTFNIHIKGIGGHSSTPEKTIDPVYIGSTLVQSMQSIVSRKTSPFDSVVISVTQFHAGTADNIIPATANLSGTIRFVKNAMIATVQEQIEQLVVTMGKSFGAEVSVVFHSMVPATINSDAESNLVKRVAIDLYGEDNVIELKNNLMATEDFAFYLNKIPGCFFLVGAGEDKHYLHHPKYDFDDEIIPVAAKVMVNTALRFLEINTSS